MLKEKIVLEFENMKEAIKALEDEHKKYDSLYERELVKEIIKDIIKKIERVNGANQGTIKNEETWDYGNEEFFVVEKYEKYTAAGASMYDERLLVEVEMNTEEIEMELEIKFSVEIVNLIDAPFRHDSFGTLTLCYSFK